MPHVTVQVQLGSYKFQGRAVESLEVRQAVGEHAECTLVFDRDPRSKSETQNVEAAALADATLQIVLQQQDDDPASSGQGGSPAAAAATRNGGQGLFTADGIRSAGVLTAKAAVGAAVRTAIVNRNGSGRVTTNAVLDAAGGAVGPQVASEVGHQLDFRDAPNDGKTAETGATSLITTATSAAIANSRKSGRNNTEKILDAVGTFASDQVGRVVDAGGNEVGKLLNGSGNAAAANGAGAPAGASGGAGGAAGTQFLAFDGVVREVDVEYHPNGGARFTIRAFSRSYELSAHADQKYFPKQTIAGLAKKLEIAVVGDVPAGQPRDYAQVGESAHAFILRRAAAEGLQLRAKWGRRPGESASESLELGKGFAEVTHTLLWGRTLTRFTVAYRPTNHGVTGSFTDPKKKHTHNYKGVRKEPQWLSGAKPMVEALKTAAPKDAGGGDPGFVDVGGPGGTQARTHEEFHARLERASAARLGGAIHATGESTEPALRAGDLIEVASAGGAGGLIPTAWQPDASSKEKEGVYGLTSVVHKLEHGNYKNTFVATPWADYHATPKAVEAGIARQTALLGGADAAGTEAAGVGGLAAAGLELAVVTDDHDAAHPGCVRVRYRWMEKDEQSNWLRVGGFGGGKGHGAAAMPLKSNLVLVGFPHGDREHGVVMLTIWGETDAPGHSRDRQHWMNRSGSGLSLNAGQGGAPDHVMLHTPGGKAMVKLNGSNVTIHAAGDISIEAPKGNVHIAAKTMSTMIDSDVSHFVGGKCTDQVTGQYVIESAAVLGIAAPTIQVSAATSLLASAGGTTQIQGAPVLINPDGSGGGSADAGGGSGDGSWSGGGFTGGGGGSTGGGGATGSW